MIFDDDSPEYKAPQMDPKAKALIDKSIAEKDQPTVSAYAEADRSAQDSTGLLPTAENMERQDASMGRNNKAQMDAILQKGESLFSSNQRKLLLTNKLNSFGARSKQLGQKYELSHKQWQFFEHIRQERLAAEANRIATRNAVIGDVLGAVGMVAGGVVGGPAGAMAGGAAGKAIGGAATKNSTQQAYDQTNKRMWNDEDYNTEMA